MYFLFYSISLRSDKNMMGLQNLCTLFGPTLMKLSPKEQQIDDMAKEIKESMQQAQALFYILKLHEENRLIADPEQKEQLEKIAQTQQNNESPTKKSSANIADSQTADQNILKLDINKMPNTYSNNNLNINNNMRKRYEKLTLKEERSPRANMQTAL